MKRNSLRLLGMVAIALTFAANHSFAQKGKEKNNPSPATTQDCSINSTIQRYRQVYESALNYNDFAVASDAMYHLIALQPENTALKDTLAAIYFQRGAWPQVVLLTTEILEKNAKNQAALELRAVANQSIGRAKESLEDYEALYKETKNPYHLYEIAALQLSMKRFGECDYSVKQLLADGDLKDKTIAITLQDGRSQDVPITAAAMNLHGVLDLEQGKKESAKAYFENALKIYPEFLLAKGNLDAMDKM